METLQVIRGVIELGLLVAVLLVAREIRALREEVPKIRSVILQPRVLDFPSEMFKGKYPRA